MGMSGVDIYVGLDLECWGSVSLRESDLFSGYINIKNHIQKRYPGRLRDFPLRAHLVPIPEWSASHHFRLHDSDLGLYRTVAARRLRSSSFDSQAP